MKNTYQYFWRFPRKSNYPTLALNRKQDLAFSKNYTLVILAPIARSRVSISS